MLVTSEGQVTIPKHIRDAAGVAPGSELAFSLEGSRIVITPVRNDRRERLRAAAAQVRSGMDPAFRQMGADDILRFLRTDDAPSAPSG